MASKSVKFDRTVFRLLIQEFKDKYNIDCSSQKDFETIRELVNEETKEELENRLNEREESENRTKDEGKLSDDTIKRAFEFKKSYRGSHDATTCSIIARKVDYKGWDDFCEKAKLKYDYINGSQTTNMYAYNTLNIGQRVTIGWYPRKYCILMYLGDFEFEIIENQGLKSEIGRKIETTGFILDDSKNKYELPDIIIEPILDDCIDAEAIKMGFIPIESLL